MKWLCASAGMWFCVLAVALLRVDVATRVDASAGQAPAGAAYFVRSLDNPRDRREVRGDILDTPVLPGSIAKTVALVSALESGVITANSSHLCRRVVTVDGQTYTCSHPDLKRALSPAEALAYSCNDFFVSLAPRLSRDALNRTRIAAGLAPIANDVSLSRAIVGLAGPKSTPRALVDVLAKLTGSGADRPVAMRPETRAVLIEGLTGAARFGTASAFKSAGLSAMAKTGSIVMPSGTALGLVVALLPAEKPSRAIVVAAPGAAGLDAAAIAADVIRGRDTFSGIDRKLLGTAPAATSAGGVQVAKKSPDPVIRLGRTLPNGGTKVETIALDDYIAQVLAGEGQPKAADAAQQALAITARTFALANRNRHRGEGFDLCDTTHCQVVRASTDTTRRAAEATSGRVLLSQGQPAFVFYSAWCGGKSELASQVWPGAIDYAYEPSVHDEACEDEPGWVSEVKVQDIEQALRAAGLRGTRLRGLRVLTRNASDRVAKIGLDGFTPGEMTGHEFRMAVGRVAGWQALKSTAFDIARTSTGYRFRGKGFGHGVGLCVIGAGKRALQGATADQILKFYFPGLTIGSVGAATTLTTGPSTRAPATPVAPSAPVVAPVAPVAPAAPAPSDVLLALPGSEEGERAVVLSLIRSGRDSLSKTVGVAAPQRLRVTVHPTVDSFRRATGQPWWVSGATNGADIDLLPISVMRQQGQLERTVRHELAHALIDDALAKRPMWVREGAAAYFSRTTPGADVTAAKVSCPSDQELTRPLSAGAQREAYARAEACFARAIAGGKKWTEVR